MSLFTGLRNRSTALTAYFKKDPLRLVLVALILFVSFYKLSLIGEGFLAFPDESRYTRSGKALKDISEAKIHDALNEIFSTQGRPADALVKTIPNLFQFITSRIHGTGTYESSNSYPLFWFNFIVHGFFLLVLYRLARGFIRDEAFALLAVLFFSLLCNSSIYLRHALPYDASLLLLYFVIYRIIERARAGTMHAVFAMRCGFLSFFGYLMYPGYFPLFLIAGFLLVFMNLERNEWQRRLSLALWFALGTGLCLAIFEIISRSVGNSYLESAGRLSGTVTQGSFEESFIFILRYLSEVEGVSGYVLISGLVIGMVFLFRSQAYRASNTHHAFFLTLFAFAGMYLCYAGAGYFMHKVVYYGRLLHQYLPVLCLVSAFAGYQMIQNAPRRRWLVLLVLAPMTIHFIIKIAEYKTYVYPRDVFWQVIYKYQTTDIQTKEEYSFAMSLLPVQSELSKAKIHPLVPSPKMTVVNGAYFFPVSDTSGYHAFQPPPDAKLLFSKPHFSGFNAYQYEGYSISERKNLNRYHFKVMVLSEP
jgi:hypothetical protein